MDKFIPPVHVIDFNSGFGLKVIDLIGEEVKNTTPRPLEKKGHEFVPLVNMTIDLSSEDNRDWGTLVRHRLDRESPEEAEQEQSVGNKAADVNVKASEETSGSSIRLDQEPPKAARQLLQSPVIVWLLKVKEIPRLCRFSFFFGNSRLRKSIKGGASMKNMLILHLELEWKNPFFDKFSFFDSIFKDVSML